MYFCLSAYRYVNFLTNCLLSRLCLFASLLIFYSSAHAISISAYRIYLAEDQRDMSFIIFNREANFQDCNLSLTHNNFDENSNLSHVPDHIIPENSANEWIRFSPREFSLTPAQSQTIRFSMRRKANAQDGEYRSYLVIDCGIAHTPNTQDTPQVSLQTKLVHSVPIVVRSGKLEASVWFDDFEMTSKGLKFSMHRKGNRSVYGDLEVIDKTTNDLIFVQRNFSIYPESKRFNFLIEEKNINPNNLKFRYTEKKEYGGNIILEKDGIQ